MQYCPNCGKELDDSYVFCPECGAKNACTDEPRSEETAQFKKCPSCGETMPLDMFYCLSCGHLFYEKKHENKDDLKAVVQRVKMTQGVWKNKWVALILCILFGWLGVHRFYEQKIISGVLFFCTLGFCGIGWIIDIIRIARKPNPYRVK